MEQFIKTKFFRTLLEASQKGGDIDACVLKREFVKFAKSVFLANTAATAVNRTAYYHSLVYTRVELPGLTEVSGKKCGCLFEKSR